MKIVNSKQSKKQRTFLKMKLTENKKKANSEKEGNSNRKKGKR